MSNNKLQTKTNTYSLQNKILKNKTTLKNVRQDKYAFQCVRTALRQPVTVENPMRTRRLNNSKPRVKKRYVNKNGLVLVTAYFDPIVKEKLRQFASEQGISVNKAIAFILKRYLQEEILRDQAELIKPVIENAIAREMQEACEILEALEDRLFLKNQYAGRTDQKFYAQKHPF